MELESNILETDLGNIYRYLSTELQFNGLPNEDLMDDIDNLPSNINTVDMLLSTIKTCFDKYRESPKYPYALYPLTNNKLDIFINKEQVLFIIAKIKDIITPRILNYIYIKIETGGLSGYDSRLKILGERMYPLLRVVLKINDTEPLDVLIKNYEYSTYSHYAKEMHEKSGLFDMIKENGFGLMESLGIIKNHFKTNQIRLNDDTTNRINVLVASNPGFILNFFKYQLDIIPFFHYRTIDINKINAIHEFNGDYDKIFNGVIYKDDPLLYVNNLRDHHKYTLKTTPS
jgi:oligoribonuclease (3'-5' exoribonuclease)